MKLFCHILCVWALYICYQILMSHFAISRWYVSDFVSRLLSQFVISSLVEPNWHLHFIPVSYYAPPELADVGGAILRLTPEVIHMTPHPWLNILWWKYICCTRPYNPLLLREDSEIIWVLKNSLRSCLSLSVWIWRHVRGKTVVWCI